MQPSFDALGSTLSGLEHGDLDLSLELQAEGHNSTGQSAPSTSQSQVHSFLTSHDASAAQDAPVTAGLADSNHVSAQLLSSHVGDKDHEEVKKQANRAAQKKFRQRQKVEQLSLLVGICYASGVQACLHCYTAVKIE